MALFPYLSHHDFIGIELDGVLADAWSVGSVANAKIETAERLARERRWALADERRVQCEVEDRRDQEARWNARREEENARREAERGWRQRVREMANARHAAQERIDAVSEGVELAQVALSWIEAHQEPACCRILATRVDPFERRLRQLGLEVIERVGIVETSWGLLHHLRVDRGPSP